MTNATNTINEAMIAVACYARIEACDVPTAGDRQSFTDTIYETEANPEGVITVGHDETDRGGRFWVASAEETVFAVEYDA